MFIDSAKKSVLCFLQINQGKHSFHQACIYKALKLGADGVFSVGVISRL
jgi:hypothetical protein